MLIETPWETRNLGLPAFAVTDDFVASPDFDALADRLKTLEGGFIAVRIDVRNTRLVDAFSRLGFYVVEQITEFSASNTDDDLLATYRQNPAAFFPPRLVASDIEIVASAAPDSVHGAAIAQLADGAFSTDRFHRDFRCPTEIADRRTQLWLAQIATERDVEELVVTYRGRPITYSYRRGRRILVGSSGASATYGGISQLAFLATRERSREAGYPNLTSVATNSFNSLNAHFRSGFQARRQAYTLHWWSTETPYATSTIG